MQRRNVQGGNIAAVPFQQTKEPFVVRMSYFCNRWPMINNHLILSIQTWPARGFRLQTPEILEQPPRASSQRLSQALSVLYPAPWTALVALASGIRFLQTLAVWLRPSCGGDGPQPRERPRQRPQHQTQTWRGPWPCASRLPSIVEIHLQWLVLCLVAVPERETSQLAQRTVAASDPP
jgi:hypothetical protein